MCLAVYLASSMRLPEGKWQEDAPAFYLESVEPEHVVRKQFLHRHVYYAGSHEGCGCGFSKDGRDDIELATRQQNYDLLAAAIELARQQGAQLQLFTCWEGEQSSRPESEDAVSLERLRQPSFELQQLHLVTVRD